MSGADVSQASAAKKASVAQLYSKFRKPQVPDASPRDVYSRIQRKDPRLLIVDCREQAEQEVSVLPGPTLTRNEWESRASGLQSSQHDVVCYCTAGLRSGNFAEKLRQQGYEAANLEGSILGWTHEQLPLVELHDRDRPTRRVHVFAPRWALQAEGYEPVWHDAPAGAAAVARGMLGSVWSYMDPRQWWAAPKK